MVSPTATNGSMVSSSMASAVNQAPLLVEAGYALNFINTPIENLHPDTYDTVLSLANRYKLGCGGPSYREHIGRKTSDEHVRYLNEFKPAIARAFGDQLKKIAEAKNPIGQYEAHQLASLNFADMVKGGILIFSDAEEFNIRMAKMALDRMVERSDRVSSIGDNMSSTARRSRYITYALYFIFFCAWQAGKLAAGGEGDFISGALMPASMLSVVAESVALLDTLFRVPALVSTRDEMILARSVNEACNRSLLGLRGMLINELAGQTGTGKLPFGA